MLFGQDLVGKSCSIIASVYRYFCLNYRRAAIQLFGNKVHRGAGFAVTGIQRALVGVEAGVLRQQRGVNIQQAPQIVAHEAACENAHKTSEDHEIGPVLVDGFLQRGIKRLAAAEVGVWQAVRGYSGAFGPLQAASVSLVADNGDDVATAQLLRLGGINNGLQVRAATGDQNYYTTAHHLQVADNHSVCVVIAGLNAANNHGCLTVLVKHVDNAIGLLC